MKYLAPLDETDPDAGYHDGDEATATLGSIPPAAAFEGMQREIVHVITQSGQTPSGTDWTQLYVAITTIITTMIAAATLAVASVAEILAGTAEKVVRVDRLWAAAAPVTLAYASTVNIDLSTGTYFQLTLTGNVALTFSNAKPGQQFEVDIIQDGTGGRTASWATGLKWPTSTAPALSTAAGKIDRLVGKCLSTSVVRAQLAKGWSA